MRKVILPRYDGGKTGLNGKGLKHYELVRYSRGETRSGSKSSTRQDDYDDVEVVQDKKEPQRTETQTQKKQEPKKEVVSKDTTKSVNIPDTTVVSQPKDTVSQKQIESPIEKPISKPSEKPQDVRTLGPVKYEKETFPQLTDLHKNRSVYTPVEYPVSEQNPYEQPIVTKPSSKQNSKPVVKNTESDDKTVNPIEYIDKLYQSEETKRYLNGIIDKVIKEDSPFYDRKEDLHDAVNQKDLTALVDFGTSAVSRLKETSVSKIQDKTKELEQKAYPLYDQYLKPQSQKEYEQRYDSLAQVYARQLKRIEVLQQKVEQIKLRKKQEAERKRIADWGSTTPKSSEVKYNSSNNYGDGRRTMSSENIWLTDPESSFGTRNRYSQYNTKTGYETTNQENVNDIGKAAGIITSYTPFFDKNDPVLRQQKIGDLDTNWWGMYYGVNKDGKFVFGTNVDEFEDGTILTRAPVREITGLSKGSHGEFLTSNGAKWQENEFGYTVGTENKNGSRGSLNYTSSTHARDVVHRGREIIICGKEARLISGTLKELDAAIEDMKKRHNSETVLLVECDNGSYSRGLRTRDGNLTSNDIYNHFRMNGRNGHFLYMKEPKK